MRQTNAVAIGIDCRISIVYACVRQYYHQRIRELSEGGGSQLVAIDVCEYDVLVVKSSLFSPLVRERCLLIPRVEGRLEREKFSNGDENWLFAFEQWVVVALEG